MLLAQAETGQMPLISAAVKQDLTTPPAPLALLHRDASRGQHGGDGRSRQDAVLAILLVIATV